MALFPMVYDAVFEHIQSFPDVTVKILGGPIFAAMDALVETAQLVECLDTFPCDFSKARLDDPAAQGEDVDARMKACQESARGLVSALKNLTSTCREELQSTADKLVEEIEGCNKLKDGGHSIATEEAEREKTTAESAASDDLAAANATTGQLDSLGMTAEITGPSAVNGVSEVEEMRTSTETLQEAGESIQTFLAALSGRTAAMGKAADALTGPAFVTPQQFAAVLSDVSRQFGDVVSFLSPPAPHFKGEIMDFDLGIEIDGRKRRRNRTTQSCLNCHTSKRKCDRKRPCQRCIQLGLTGLCVYEVDDPAARDDPSVGDVTRLRTRIAELESLVRELRGKPHPRWADPNFQDGVASEKWQSRPTRRTALSIQSSGPAFEQDQSTDEQQAQTQLYRMSPSPGPQLAFGSTEASCTCLTNQAAGAPLIALTHQLQNTDELLRQLPEHAARQNCTILRRIAQLNDLMHGGTGEGTLPTPFDGLPATDSELLSPVPTSSHASMAPPIHHDLPAISESASTAQYDSYFPVSPGDSSMYHKSDHIN